MAITACGTFALVGSSLGSIDMYNLQSGLHRQRYPAKSKLGRIKSAANGSSTNTNLESDPSLSTPSSQWKHLGAVTGIAVDGINRTVVSCGLDGRLKACSCLKTEGLIVLI